MSQMWANVAIDFLVGLIPFVGDLVDAMFRCNTKNVALLEKHLKQKHGPRDSIARDRAGLEAFSDDSDPFIPGGGGDVSQHRYDPQDGRQPSSRVSRQPQPTAQRSWRGWFGDSQRERLPDAENGQQNGTVRI